MKDFFVYDSASPFLFTSTSFWVFFLMVIFGFTLLYKQRTLRNNFLLVCSLFFYYKTGGGFVFLLFASILINYIVGRCIDKAYYPPLRKFYLFVGVLLNLLILVYFKYSYFAVDSINAIVGGDFEVTNLFAVFSNHLYQTSFNESSIILPVGISFFTFQALSYIIDIYRKQVKSLSNILDLGFYISFFPQLVAGPIVRAGEFLPQLKTHYMLTSKEFSTALMLIMGGLFKKMIISDYLAINFIDNIFQNPSLYTGFETWLSMYAYSIQIYCDFSGYTDIAIGVAALLGFKLPINFNSPYKATSIREFWHRWHISLSTWFRDYLYIPLGGSRKGVWRTYFNILTTMLLCGLWHGANIKFLVWAALHSLFMCIERLVPKRHLPKILKVFLCFTLISWLWLFFRADDINDALYMTTKLFQLTPFDDILQICINYYKIILIMLLAMFLHYLPDSFIKSTTNLFHSMPYFIKIIIVCMLVGLIQIFRTSGGQSFIYFQF